MLILMERQTGPKHFSMIRGFHLADFLTLGNAACGVGAVFLAMLYLESKWPIHFFVACALAPAAFAFDVFDGKVARMRHEHSALGRELDSLADVISFGVAPAAIGFAALDVFEVEPLPVDSPLWSHPRVLVSPHTAALSSKEEERIARRFADSATRLLDGRPLPNVVDTVEFY